MGAWRDAAFNFHHLADFFRIVPSRAPYVAGFGPGYSIWPLRSWWTRTQHSGWSWNSREDSRGKRRGEPRAVSTGRAVTRCGAAGACKSRSIRSMSGMTQALGTESPEVIEHVLAEATAVGKGGVFVLQVDVFGFVILACK